MLVVNGWQLFAHPLLLDQLDRLEAAVERARVKDLDGWRGTASAKVLAAVHRLMWEVIPADPTRAEYRQGHTLGEERKHWFRAKFARGRYRLFFRYLGSPPTIVYAWFNDEGSLRTYGSKTDAYSAFARMLNSGNPPEDWGSLMAHVTRAEVQKRMDGLGEYSL